MRRLFQLLAVLAGIAPLTALVPDRAEARFIQTGQKAPESLVDVGEFGENIYDLAKARDWPKVMEKFKALETAAKQLPADLQGAPQGIKHLDSVKTALRA
jgi:hypothetical protein